MKKEIVKILSALLCLTLMGIAIVGCGNKNKETTAGGGPSTPAENGIWLPFIEN